MSFLSSSFWCRMGKRDHSLTFFLSDFFNRKNQGQDRLVWGGDPVQVSALNPKTDFSVFDLSWEGEGLGLDSGLGLVDGKIWKVHFWTQGCPRHLNQEILNQDFKSSLFTRHTED